MSGPIGAVGDRGRSNRAAPICWTSVAMPGPAARPCRPPRPIARRIICCAMLRLRQRGRRPTVCARWRRLRALSAGAAAAKSRGTYPGNF